MNRRQRRALAREIRSGRPDAPVVDAARRQVEDRLAARIARQTDPTVVLPDVDPEAVAVLRADREARGGLTPDEALAVLAEHLDRLEADG